MWESHTQKLGALCLGVVVLLSLAFASTEEQAAASKLPLHAELLKTHVVERQPEPVIEPVLEAPVMWTSAAVADARWSPNVTITSGVADFRFESDGLPEHELPSRFVAQQRGYAAPAGSAFSSLDVVAPLVEYPIDRTITLNPVLADEPAAAPEGLIGVLVNGTQIYNDPESFAIAEMASLEYGFVDICNGHPNVLVDSGQRVGGYHYHAVPSCTTDSIDIEGQHSSVVGFMIDGFPVYGSNDVGGVAIRPWDLDECSGHFGPTPEFPDGIYHYHFLDDLSADPFPCLSGEFDDVLADVVEPAPPRTRRG